MKNRGNWIERLAEGMELGDEPVPGQSLVEICGDGRVLIENHKGVQCYAAGEISVKVSYGTVSVRGCGLWLARMTREQLVIRGRIDGVCITRREKR